MSSLRSIVGLQRQHCWRFTMGLQHHIRLTLQERKNATVDRRVTVRQQLKRIDMDLGGGRIGTNPNFNNYLAILGKSAEYECRPNNCYDKE